ncbi:hypothetical protein QBC45DRAFT_468935 [Copromyces sp. CBS 386.78]|nr:hypothetical protein QBC45DRAFT_468935 [Copromyces sp. CBS 386.78]
MPSRRQPDERLFKPQMVFEHDDLKDLYHNVKDGIIVSIDLECADHCEGSSYERLSEVGMSWYDPRDDHSRPFTAERALPKIRSVHCIIRKYKNFSADSCYAEEHLRRPHKAMPYSCYFAKSYICNREKALDIIRDKMKWFSEKGLTEDEAAAGTKRKVIVLYWDPRLETSQWDFQLLYPFKRRFGRSRNRAAEMFHSLGVGYLPSSPAFQDEEKKYFAWHNATNDCWATVAGFLQVLSMATQTWKWERWMEKEKTDEEWDRLEMDPKERRKGRDLKALDMSWLKARILERNAALAPPPEKWPKDPLGHREAREQMVHGVLDFF